MRRGITNVNSDKNFTKYIKFTLLLSIAGIAIISAIHWSREKNSEFINQLDIRFDSMLLEEQTLSEE